MYVYVCVSSTSYGIMYMLNNLKITVGTFLIKDDVNMGNLFMFRWGIAGQMVLPWFKIVSVICICLSSRIACFLDGLVSLNMELPQ